MKDFDPMHCPKCGLPTVMDRARAHDLNMVCGNKGDNGEKCKYVYTDEQAELVLGVRKVYTVDNEGNPICAFINVGNGHEFYHSWYCLKRFKSLVHMTTHDKLYHNIGDRMAGCIPSGFIIDFPTDQCGNEEVIAT